MLTSSEAPAVGLMWAATLGVLAASAVLTVLAAILAPKQRTLAITLAAMVQLVLPWFAGPILVRALLALNFIVVFRTIDLTRCPDSWRVLRRLVHTLDVVDTRLLRRERPRMDLIALVPVLGWGALAALTLQAVRIAPHCTFNPMWLRFSAGLVFAYSTIEAGYRIVRIGHRALGFETPPLHTWPLASLTVTEFWGKRWARPVSQWLRANCFLPLARRGHPALGLLLAFVVSAFGHAYPVLVALGPTMTAMMFGYFLIQGIVVVAEARLGVAKWPRTLQRCWTILLMVTTSPLFVEPCLRIVLSE